MWEDLSCLHETQITEFVDSCFLHEKCRRISPNIWSGTIPSRFSVGRYKVMHLLAPGWRTDSVTTMSSRWPHFAPNFSITHFSSQIVSSLKPGRHFKQFTNPYHYKRSFLIGSPLNSLSLALLNEPQQGTIIHHTLNLFCHFSFGWKIRAGGHIDFIKNMKLRLQKWNVCLLSIIALITMTDRGKRKHTSGPDTLKKRDIQIF